MAIELLIQHNYLRILKHKYMYICKTTFIHIYASLYNRNLYAHISVHFHIFIHVYNVTSLIPILNMNGK
jgi:hypothetical protein